MTKSTPADPNDPEHKRLIDIVDRVYAKSGLKYKPPVYISDNPLPNAFATGPIHRKAVVAATKGLFLTGMTDAEIEAVFAHELRSVKNYDVAINSMLSVLSMIFFMITDAGVRVLLSLASASSTKTSTRQQSAQQTAWLFRRRSGVGCDVPDLPGDGTDDQNGPDVCHAFS